MKRVLLKLSGEALAGEKKTGFDEATVIEVAKQIRTIAEEGLEIGIVIGGSSGSYRYRWWQFLERTYQRDHRPYKSRSDRYACNSYELYLCI